MTSPRTLKKNDIVSVKIAGTVFILPVEGYYDRNRAIIHLRTPSGFLITVAPQQIVALHGADRNIISLFTKERPPLCIHKTCSLLSS